MKRILIYILMTIMVFSSSQIFVSAHPGDTDANGGHYNRKTGVYHYHNGDNSSSDSRNDIYERNDLPPVISATKVSKEDYDDGYSTGYSKGIDVGEDVGYDIGHKEGYDTGYSKGIDVGENVGYDIGHKEGYDMGFKEGMQKINTELQTDAHNEGHKKGLEKGIEQGIEESKVIFKYVVSVFLSLILLTGIISFHLGRRKRKSLTKN